ncbi:MAG: hypothetical protein EZS28_029137 [Streblomastix strix]|uniref:Uncharacterized protein n=1 Tax=Streblomastix strix TaxID=222440 RepID=A0A5J4UYA8_9EUKA|nr:MAG: hypothetical protein EZS28_029137 [Streblomastix strix]
MSQSDNHSDIIDYSKVVETLRIPFVGSEIEKQNISKQQKDVCLKIITELKDKTDDKGRQNAINAGVTQELSYILESRNLSEISLPLIEAFDCITFPGDKVDFRPIIYEKYDPFPGLIRLLELKDNEMLRVVIKIICSMINGGIKDNNSEHPYFESIISIDGENKIFSLFQRADMDNKIRNMCAIYIGRLFKSQELPETMKQPIIDHLKSITSDQDEWTRSESIQAIDYLAQNKDLEILSDAYNFIGYDFVLGAESAEENKPNQLFQEISECGGIEILFDLFQRNLSEKSRDNAASILALLFVNQEFPNALMRKEIIQHFINPLINADSGEQEIDTLRLKYLARIAGNHFEILKDDFIDKALQALPYE